MNKINTYSIKGIKKNTDFELPKDLSEEVNIRLLAQAIRVYENRLHPGLSQVKTRAEVVASKKEVYRQKGTGRARHGKITAPIFVGGGKAHGPDGKKRMLSLPKKMRDKAFKMAMTMKARQGNLFVIEKIFDIKKTKDASEMLKKIFETEKIKPDSKVLIALSDNHKDTVLYLRNIANVSTVPYSSLNAYNVYFSKIVIVDEEAFEEKNSKKEIKKAKIEKINSKSKSSSDKKGNKK